MRYFIASTLALVTYSDSAGKGIPQHATYETVGPMFARIEVSAWQRGITPDISLGTLCHDLGIRSVGHSSQYSHTANHWLNRARVRDHEEEIRYVQFTQNKIHGGGT